MPDLSGYEVLELLRDDVRTASIPVVMLSADASHEQIQRFRDLGVRDYLTKPLDLQYFLTQFDDYLQDDES
jgi:CheY-like chemotaxis protein